MDLLLPQFANKNATIIIFLILLAFLRIPNFALFTQDNSKSEITINPLPNLNVVNNNFDLNPAVRKSWVDDSKVIFHNVSISSF